MEGHAIQEEKFSKAGAGGLVDGIAFRDSAELDYDRRH